MFDIMARYGPEGQLRHLFRGAEAVSHGPDRSSDHGHSPVAAHGGRCPCCAVLLFSSADVEETAELPQLQLVEYWTVVACPLCATTGVLSMTWRSSSTLVDVAVLPQRQVPAVGLDSWEEG